MNENIYEDQILVQTDAKTWTVSPGVYALTGSFNYERMQSSGWLYGLPPCAEEVSSPTNVTLPVR
ncbi:hypothetical protein ACNKHO_19735 [Shigella flexneri]